MNTPRRLLLLSVAVAACSGPIAQPSPTPAPSASTSPIGQFGGRRVLAIENGTPIAVTLVVNGVAIGTAEPGIVFPEIDFASLPALPWTVEARSPSGRVLTSMHVGPDSVTTTTDPNGNVATTGTIGRVDLSCGRITIYAGYDAPSGPVPPSPAGSPGDCVP
jgi:hypothetical protein